MNNETVYYASLQAKI